MIERDIGICDLCGDEELPRKYVLWKNLPAWVCTTCLTSDPHIRLV